MLLRRKRWGSAQPRYYSPDGWAAHTPEAPPPDPAAQEGRGEAVTDKVSESVCSMSTLRDRLTKCAGDGDLASLTVALEGTSRRGHFICRYCMGDRT